MLVAIGTLVATVPLAVAVHLLHAFPNGRLSGRAARLTVLAGYLVATVLQAPQYLFRADAEPYHLLWIADRPELAALGRNLQSLAGSAVMIATGVLLAMRLRRATPDRRRILVLFFGYGILVVLIVPLSPNVIGPLLDLSVEATVALQLLVLAGLPAVFAVGVLRGTFARTGEIQELGAVLGATGVTRPDLDQALARTLGDPGLSVAFWMTDTDGYVDADGHPVRLPDGDDPDRAVLPIDLADHRVGAIVFDPVLAGDPDLVREAAAVVAIAADRERLTAELRASREALRRSRERIVDAGDRERQRVARDLHDGLQVRLLMLAVQAQQIGQDHPDAESRMDVLRAGIDDAAAELRAVVQSIMPAALIERGLIAATEDLVDRLRVPATLDLDLASDRSLPAVIQRAAYFIVAEALTNALKHSHAREVGVRLARAGGWLTVQVSDDGVGLGPPGTGTGLRGMADRADVLGGRMTVTVPPDGGTTIRVELPCGS